MLGVNVAWVHVTQPYDTLGFAFTEERHGGLTDLRLKGPALPDGHTLSDQLQHL